MRNSQTLSYFQQTFDVVVYGSGYGGLAAAMQLHRAGKKVLLVNRLADLMWESGRSFCMDSGSCDAGPWRQWLDHVSQRGGLAEDGRIDGAIAEVLATLQIAERKLPVLYYVTPVAVQMAGSALEAVIVGTKAGARRLVARQWIDASETGELCRLIDRTVKPRAAAQLQWRAFYQNNQWENQQEQTIPGIDPAVSLQWQQGIWPTERYLTAIMPGNVQQPRLKLLPALQSLHDALPQAMVGAVLSHCTLDLLPIYDAAAAPAWTGKTSNVACVSPAMIASPIGTLAQRYELGLNAAAALRERDVHEAGQAASQQPADFTAVQPLEVIESDVVVAGAGTGGAVAAIAAGRAGASVTCIDPLSFAGGIGSGGGIHWYYFGVAGGLQEEIDQRVEKVMKLFGKKSQVRGFHPDAKKLVLEQMLHEAGVRFLPHTALVDVRTSGRSVNSALAGRDVGPVELRAKCWIDATGDGDLSAMAGASFCMGRDGDGGLHAYSQSSGKVKQVNDAVSMTVVNFDAGWVDPTNSEDLTRGRLVGISHYHREHYTPEDHPTYIAPAIGLRQARQINTDHILSLADLIERRHFPDAIGFTGAHYDNHAVDYEFESDEAVFWVWVCRQWRSGRTACQMPYRMIVPRDLDNVWLACRAVGVSMDAHHSCRMQRDMQRIGEAAGYGAALAIKHHTDARHIPINELHRALAQTGAVDLDIIDIERDFGPIASTEVFHDPSREAFLAEGINDLRSGRFSDKLWYVYRAGEQVGEQVLACLADDNPTVSWLAAGIAATWGDSRAEDRLLQAIAAREYGFDAEPEADRPEKNRRVVPNWLAAVTLLRTCGTEKCVPVLQTLADQAHLALNVRTAIAMTLQRLAQRGVLTNAAAAGALLDALLREPIPGAMVPPQRSVFQTLQEEEPLPVGPTSEDHAWQLHLAVAKARLALGLDLHPQAEQYRHDGRALVRAAFAKLKTPVAAAS